MLCTRLSIAANPRFENPNHCELHEMTIRQAIDENQVDANRWARSLGITQACRVTRDAIALAGGIPRESIDIDAKSERVAAVVMAILHRLKKAAGGRQPTTFPIAFSLQGRGLHSTARTPLVATLLRDQDEAELLVIDTFQDPLAETS